MELTLLNNMLIRKSNNTSLSSGRSLNKSVEKTTDKAQTNNITEEAVKMEVSDNLLSELKEKEDKSIETQQHINKLDTANTTLEKTSERITRIKELAIQANSDSITEEEKNKLFDKMKEQITHINKMTDSSEFQELQLVDGNKEKVQIKTKEAINNVKTETLEFTKENTTESKNLINTVDNALKMINSQRSEIEAYQNELNSSITSTETSNPQIKDANIANISADIAKQNILQKSLTNLTMQLNANPSMALSLLAA